MLCQWAQFQLRRLKLSMWVHQPGSKSVLPPRPSSGVCFPKQQRGKSQPRGGTRTFPGQDPRSSLFFKCTTKGIPWGWGREMLQNNRSPLRTFSLETFIFTLQPKLFPDVFFFFKLKEHFPVQLQLFQVEMFGFL